MVQNTATSTGWLVSIRGSPTSEPGLGLETEHGVIDVGTTAKALGLSAPL